METIQVTYRILFSVEVTLAQYPDNVSQYLRVIPDAATQGKLPDYQIITRQQKNTMVYLITVEDVVPDEDEPVIPLAADEVFRFYVKIPDAHFLGRTHLRAYPFDTEVLLLSNQANHAVGSEILLSQTIPNYNGAETYLPGYLVQTGLDFFRALQASDAGDPHGTAEPDYWQSITNGTYVSQADLVPRPAGDDLDSLMIIELTHSNTVPIDYQFLDIDSKCKEVNYKIKLLP